MHYAYPILHFTPCVRARLPPPMARVRERDLHPPVSCPPMASHVHPSFAWESACASRDETHSDARRRLSRRHMLADLPSETLRGLGHVASARRESSRPSRHTCLGRALAEVGLQQHREQPGRVLSRPSTLPAELELAKPRRLVRSMDVPWVVFSGDANHLLKSLSSSPFRHGSHEIAISDLRLRSQT
jgi:hypothetical protein